MMEFIVAINSGQHRSKQPIMQSFTLVSFPYYT